jgi:hypothetical protein
MKSGIAALERRLSKIRSRMGKFFPGERVVFRGQDLHTDLAGTDWLDLYSYGITGRRLSAAQVRFLHGLFVNTSFPDARIWNNRVAALAGTARTTPGLGLSAALAVSEAHIYGGGVFIQGMHFLIDAVQGLGKGQTLDDAIDREMSLYGRLAGYGRPLINADERIAPTLKLAKALALDDGPHLKAAFEIERLLLARGRNLRLNYGALLCAFGADLGYSPREFETLLVPLFLAGMPPCYIEASEEPEGALFPLRCADILYEGREKRRWE